MLDLDRLNLILKGYPPYRSGQVYRAIFRELAVSWAEVTSLPKDFRAILERECPLKIDAVGPAFELLKRNKRTKDMIRACTAFLNRTKLPAAGVLAIVPVVSDLLLENARTDSAVKVLLVAADRCDTPEVAARMTIMAAKIVLNVVRDDKEGGRYDAP